MHRPIAPPALGLGLAIARQLVELHGGTIDVQSDGAGQGCMFTINLPLPRIQPANIAPIAIPLDQVQLNGVHILVVEDDDRTRRATARLLTDAGASVTTAASTADALKAFTASRPDIILSDIGLPDEDGYALLQKIRKIESDQNANPAPANESPVPPIPAIAFTAYARDMDRQRAQSVGFTQFLAKPGEPDRILATLAQVLQEKGK